MLELDSLLIINTLHYCVAFPCLPWEQKQMESDGCVVLGIWRRLYVHVCYCSFQCPSRVSLGYVVSILNFIKPAEPDYEIWNHISRNKKLVYMYSSVHFFLLKKSTLMPSQHLDITSVFLYVLSIFYCISNTICITQNRISKKTPFHCLHP